MLEKIKVEDMMCNHCVKTIKDKLENADIDCTVDLSSKTVEVETNDLEEAMSLIKAAGFNPVK